MCLSFWHLFTYLCQPVGRWVFLTELSFAFTLLSLASNPVSVFILVVPWLRFTLPFRFCLLLPFTLAGCCHWLPHWPGQSLLLCCLLLACSLFSSLGQVAHTVLALHLLLSIMSRCERSLIFLWLAMQRIPCTFRLDRVLSCISVFHKYLQFPTFDWLFVH